MTPNTAYIDMEFAGIYGTHQGMQIPIEIGVVIHQPDTDTLSFAGKAFNRTIDVELWKNITDDVGKRIEGQRRVFNLASRGIQKFLTKNSTWIARGERRHTVQLPRCIRIFGSSCRHSTIKISAPLSFLPAVVKWKHSRIPGSGQTVLSSVTSRMRYDHDFHLKEHVSLDRVSLVTRFRDHKVHGQF